MAAGVAGLDADVVEPLGPLRGVDRELVDALFAAGGADDTPVFPLRRAEQRAFGAVSQRPQDADVRPAGAEWGERRGAVGLGAAVRLCGEVGEGFGVGLQKDPGETQASSASASVRGAASSRQNS